MFQHHIQTVAQLYVRFNAQDIDGVLESLDENVEWANAMEGGHEHGHEAVKAYWTRQFAMVRPVVTPKDYSQSHSGDVVVQVEQRIYDLDGRPLEGEQEHELRNRTVQHTFRMKDGKVVRFDVG
ncbi:ketosteroid isomerase-like protein [Neorhizobium galegae]|uniref:nuclear transport factor 2 family protein n=1 Tax=Neorhizobium galegae TaxID=399 RepID=UPI001AE553A8|nr:nuclear transport factor 2 family protein [Neorhizobium galegae]MBP2551809.1 ketosteroid isomerase-like protein [Neorhizobium galegae]